MIIKDVFKKCNGEIIHLPKGIKLSIEETSNNVYQIEMIYSNGKSVSNQGSNIDQMVELALKDLLTT